MIKRARIVDLASRVKNESSLLASLVGAKGSSYRKPGGRLLAVNGEYAGTISGGCLEVEGRKEETHGVTDTIRARSGTHPNLMISVASSLKLITDIGQVECLV